MGPLALLLAALPATLHAQYTYSTNDGTITITRYTGTDPAASVPSTINGLPVTRLGDGAFGGSSLTNVSIPDSVTSIGNQTFERCTSLASVIIPDGVTSLGTRAFYACSSLTNVTLGSGLTNLGAGAFAFCAKLASVTIPASVTSIGDRAFASCTGLTTVDCEGDAPSVGLALFDSAGAATVYYRFGTLGWGATFGGRPAVPLWEYTISNERVTIIRYNGPGGALTVPGFINGLPVTSLGAGAFSNRFALTSVTLPDGLTRIRSYAFYACRGLKSITLGQGMTNLESYAFWGCSGLTNIALPAGLTDIGGNAFQGCSSLASLTLPASLASLGSWAFYRCSALTRVLVPASVGSLGDGVFSECTSLRWLYFEGNAPGLGASAFNRVSASAVYYLPTTSGWGLTFGGLRTVQLWTATTAEGVITLTQYAGADPELTIPPGIRGVPVARLGPSACEGKTFLARVTIPEGIVALGDRAFAGCRGLTNLTLPSSVTSLGAGVFAACTRLPAIGVDARNPAYASVDGVLFDKSQTWLIAYPGGRPGAYTVPDGATSIGAFAFFLCTNLTSVALPKSLASLADTAFLSCPNLTAITVGPLSSTYSSLDGVLFDKGQTTIVALPGGTTGTYTVPGAVTRIGNGAFRGCDRLTAIAVELANPALRSVAGVLFDQSQSALLAFPGGRTGGYSVPDGVTRIGPYAFASCASLVVVTIPDSVTELQSYSFASCSALAGVYFQGDAPGLGSLVFTNTSQATLYYLPGTLGWWGSPFGGRPIGYEPWAYAVEGESVTVARCLAGDQAVTVPTALKGLPITAIGDGAFSGRTNLASVTIPAGISRIGEAAFGFCPQLAAITVDPLNPGYTNVDGVLFDLDQVTLVAYPGAKAGSYSVPSTVTHLLGGAFQGCAGLTNVSIPASVTSIGAAPFSGCTGLIAISVDALNPAFISVDGVLFDQGQATLIACPGAKAGEYTVPEGVGTIANGAFAYCAGLTRVFLPDSVTRIGDEAFAGCGALTGAVLPARLTTLGEGAFQDCASLTELMIPSSVVSIGDRAFRGTANLAALTLEALNPNYASADGVLFDKPRTTLIAWPGGKSGGYAIPSGVTGVRKEAFRECRRLESISLPNSVTSLGRNAFSFCAGLTNVTLGNGAGSIGAAAFSDCANLRAVDVPSGVNSLGAAAFAYCARLANVTLAASVTNIGAYAFVGCAALESLSCEGNAPSLGLSVFTFANQVTVYHLPGTLGWASSFGGRSAVQPWTYTTRNGMVTITAYQGLGKEVRVPGAITGLPVTSIGDLAFSNRVTLTSVSIPNTVTSLGNHAFAYCSALRSAALGRGVTKIGVSAFAACTSLASIPIPTAVTSIGDYAFYGCRSLTTLTIPNSVTRLGEYAFAYCRSLTNVALPTSLTSVPIGAFEDCTGLLAVTIPSGVGRLGNAAFAFCSALQSLYFRGDAPSLGTAVFEEDFRASVYYLSATTGWRGTYGGLPAVLWDPRAQTSDASFGLRFDQFGFTIAGASNLVVVVEAAVDLRDPAWVPLGAYTLTGGSAYFSDPQWTNYPARFYRFGSP